MTELLKSFAVLLAVTATPTPGFDNPNHISDGLLHFFSLVNQVPMLSTLLILMGLDIVAGLTLSIYKKKLSSTISWRGMSRKVFMLLIVAAASVVEQFTGGIPVAKLAAVCYIVTEMISILENAAMAGVPLPSALVNTLTKLKDGQKTMTLPLEATVQLRASVPAAVPATAGAMQISEPKSAADTAATTTTEPADL